MWNQTILRLGLVHRAILLFLWLPNSSTAWKRNILVYHDPARSAVHWQQHLLRVNSTGAIDPDTTHWLFDSAILTTYGINGKSIYAGTGLNGTDCSDLIQALAHDAKELNTAIEWASSVRAREHPPGSAPFATYIAVPYFVRSNSAFAIPNGPTYNLGIPAQRSAAMHWYVDRVKASFPPWASVKYPNLAVAGLYYHREDIVDADVAFVQDFNSYAHAQGYQTLFVPYHDAPNVWDSKQLLGFDVVVMQPSYAFFNSIDGKDVKGSRIYGTAYKALARGMGMEYELRAGGNTQLSYWIAHQYLAISQFTGVSNNPQVFFLGGYANILDSASSLPGQANTWLWKCYSELADYLNGSLIWNYEVGILAPTSTGDPNVRQVIWRNVYRGLASVRLDFNDTDPSNIWRGRLDVLVNGNQSHSSYAQRGVVELPEVSPSYQSVFVPLASENIPAGASLTIQLRKEPSSPWPNVLRLIGAPYEPKFVASGIAGVRSTSSNPTARQPNYLDSAQTHLGYASGKLTDGKVSSQWTYDGALLFGVRGWSVTLDLGTSHPLSHVVIQTSSNEGWGFGWPSMTYAYASRSCEPAERGTVTGSCPPDFTSGAPTRVVTWFDGGSWYEGNVTLSFTPGAAGRFVTVSGTGFAMLHEISVYSGPTILSIGKPYWVSPAPGYYLDTPKWADDSHLLTDGAVFGDIITGNNHIVGILRPAGGGFVQATWDTPRTGFTYAVIWLTRAEPSWGVGLPARVTVTWRDAASIWAQGVSVPVGECSGGLAPCAKLQLPTGAQVTGVKGEFAASGLWIMVTEISLMN